jgi:uncharacterized protein (TIGR02145 family)
MSKIIFPFFLFSFCSIYGQDVFRDFIDSKEYDIINIGDLSIFKENLKFVRQTSYYAENKNDCSDGNFYYYYDADSVCPSGWRLPKWTEIEFVLKQFKTDSLIDPINTSGYEDLTSNQKSKTYKKINLYDSIYNLGLFSSGWVQGKEKVSKEELKENIQAQYWIKDDFKYNPTTHMHVFESHFTIHNHKEAILVKREKKEKTIFC